MDKLSANVKNKVEVARNENPTYLGIGCFVCMIFCALLVFATIISAITVLTNLKHEVTGKTMYLGPWTLMANVFIGSGTSKGELNKTRLGNAALARFPGC